MKPERVGRTFGAGVRIASGMLRERVARSTQAQAPKPGTPAIAERGKGLARGAKTFGRSIWSPFAHASSVLWLEITGLFFALFGLFFAQDVYKLRGGWRGGPAHSHFLISAVLMLVFFYFCASSFASARAKQRKRRAKGG
jgi:hypothetical protein